MQKRTHTAASAAMLLMVSALLSGVLALVRVKYTNFLFGAGVQQDAYRAAFKLPDLISYFLVGSAASVSLITLMNRFREAGDEEGADRALSVVLTTMLCVLSGAVVVAFAIAPLYVRFFYGATFYHDARGPLCIALTRWLLFPQLFFFVGSMLSARLQVRKIFIYQAFSPLIYNGGILLGAWTLHAKHGVFSLAAGVWMGSFAGFVLLNLYGAFATGLRYRPVIGFRNPVFREWLMSAAPLMIGVSLVMFDGIFFNRLAAEQVGQLTLINNAKDVFNAAFNIIGPAVGAASLPFFTSLFQRKLEWEFSSSVAKSVSKLAAAGLLVSGWMLALAPYLMDLLRGGKFNHADAAETTLLFRIFCVTLAVWAVQGIYARGFYAASDTKTPAIAGTIIVVVSFPFYWLFFHVLGVKGLALASDVGICVQTGTLAVLLHKRRLVSLAHLEYDEIGKALLAGVCGCGAATVLVKLLHVHESHRGDFLAVAVGTVAWAGVGGAALMMTRSRLLRQLMRKA